MDLIKLPLSISTSHCQSGMLACAFGFRDVKSVWMVTDEGMKINPSVLCSGVFQLKILENANCSQGNWHKSPAVVVNYYV